MSNGNPFELRGVQVWPSMFFLRNWNRFGEHQQPILDYLYELQASQGSTLASGVADAFDEERRGRPPCLVGLLTARDALVEGGPIERGRR